MPHIHEMYDFVIGVFIVYEDKVLLVEHPRYNKWLSIGGHIELDEDPDEALEREIFEESGLKTVILSERLSFQVKGRKNLYRPEYVEVHEANEPHKHICLIYFARALDDKPAMSDEHTNMRWFSDKELDDSRYDLDDAMKFYARAAIAKNKQS